MLIVDIAQSDDVAEGQTAQFTLGDKRIMVCRVDGVVYAIDAVCPHRGAFLSQGKLDGRVIVCPWHEWGFDVTTGEGTTNPFSSVCKYGVQEEDGLIRVEIEGLIDGDTVS